MGEHYIKPNISSGQFLRPCTCPLCGLYVHKDSNNIIHFHKRLIDGGGHGINQDHTIIECEGVGQVLID